MTRQLSRDKFRGCLLGLATGDAVGCSNEFKAPGTFQPISDMVGGGPFNLQPGHFTDDSSMALCLADSLIEHGGLVPKDVMDRWVRWWKQGEWSPKGYCFDIGNAIAGALGRYLKTGEPFAGINAANQAGNGCIMRLAPVPMFFAGDYDKALEAAADSCRLTHGADEAVALTRQFASALVLALRGEGKQALLTECLDAGREPPQVRGTGYVKDCLEAAAWAFRKGRDFRETILLAANLGSDSDTTAAVAGQIAGAHYGASGIPAEWLAKLWWRDRIEERADRLYELAAGGAR